MLHLFILYLSSVFILPMLAEIDDPSTFKKFIPNNWSYLAHAKGDLNKDKIDDLVLIIQSNTPSETIEDDYYDEDFKIYDRSMIILFGENDRRNYRQVIRNNKLIKHAESRVVSDPFSDLSIERGNIILKFNYWTSAGSWWTSKDTFVFRYQNFDFALIGYEGDLFHRATHERNFISVNFLTKKYSCTTRQDGDSPEKTTWHSFKLLKLQTLSDYENWSNIPDCID